MDMIERLAGPHEWGYRDPVEGGMILDEAPFEAAVELSRLRAYVKQIEGALNHATECCSAFQSGGQFAHLARLGEPIFDAVPRLIAKLSN